MIEFFCNIDFAKNIVAELFGVTLEVLIIAGIVSYYTRRKSKNNFNKVISSTIGNFVKTHNDIKSTIESYKIANEYPVKFKMWGDEVKSQIEELCKLQLYEFYPTLNKHLIEYKALLSEIRNCFVTQEYNPQLFDNIVGKYKLIYDSLKKDSLIVELNFWRTEELDEIKQQLEQSSWAL